MDVATPITTPAMEMKVFRDSVRFRFLLFRYRKLMKSSKGSFMVSAG